MTTQERPPSARPQRASVHLDGICVLVIDDDPVTLELVHDLLVDARATVVTALTADEALRLLRTAKPDVIVSDIDMPGCDGYQLLRMVRGRTAAEGGETPAIALTGWISAKDQTRAHLAGYQVHLAKPIKAVELIVAIGVLARPQSS